MPRRYNMISEPEQLEVVDNGVYQPDQCTPADAMCAGDEHFDRSSRNRLTMEPVVDGPITLKTVFMDSRWTVAQRRLCFVVLLSVALFCLVVLVTLFAGLGRVLAAIGRIERKRASGLQYWPNVEELADGGLLAYGFRWGDRDAADKVQFYVAEIDAVVQKYRALSDGDGAPADCGGVDVADSADRRCAFPIERILKGNCTNDNHYGYYSATPCMLFALKRPHGWSLPPSASGDYASSLNMSCKVPSHSLVIGVNSNVHVQSLDYSMWPADGFDARYLVGEPDADGGQKLEPLVMVQFTNLQQYPNRVPVVCELALAADHHDGGNAFTGMTVAQFSFTYAADGAASFT